MRLPGHRFTRENHCLTHNIPVILDWIDLNAIKDEFTPVGWCPEAEIDWRYHRGGGCHPMMVFAEGIGEIWSHVQPRTLEKYFPGASSILRALEVRNSGIEIRPLPNDANGKAGA